MHLDQAFHQGKSQSQSTAAPVEALFGLAEHIEDVGQDLRFDPYAGVLHVHLGDILFGIDRHLHGHFSSCFGELMGIVQEISDRLGEPGGITLQPCLLVGQLHFQFDISRSEKAAVILGGLFHDPSQIAALLP